MTTFDYYYKHPLIFSTLFLRNVGRHSIRSLLIGHSHSVRAGQHTSLALGCMVRYIVAGALVYGNPRRSREPHMAGKEGLL